MGSHVLGSAKIIARLTVCNSSPEQKILDGHLDLQNAYVILKPGFKSIKLASFEAQERLLVLVESHWDQRLAKGWLRLLFE